ncbi:unnamed protein product [Merluccius merluccius]
MAGVPPRYGCMTSRCDALEKRIHQLVNTLRMCSTQRFHGRIISGRYERRIDSNSPKQKGTNCSGLALPGTQFCFHVADGSELQLSAEEPFLILPGEPAERRLSWRSDEDPNPSRLPRTDWKMDFGDIGDTNLPLRH